MSIPNEEPQSVSSVQAHVPKGITQKEAIEILIPYLFVLREKGCSWNQITSLLNDKCRFKLQPSTVRSYFGEMVPKHMDICRDAMTEYLSEIAKIKKQKT